MHKITPNPKMEASTQAFDDHCGYMVDEPVRLNPEISWDKDILSYFDHWMTCCELNNEIQHGNGIKITVELHIKYDDVEPVASGGEQEVQPLLQDLSARVSALEQVAAAWLATQ